MGLGSLGLTGIILPRWGSRRGVILRLGSGEREGLGLGFVGALTERVAVCGSNGFDN